ncbi:nitroreductase/quinone reductase family protein [Nocardia crassostreae]|uniref:nitroreductase/quinone reductase family protein n=1 Tax=Nocardia crassostreae TaxID=53428 RepID=UPI00082EDD4C|nr:nitroreductase/quinone reductase family protein [Nocardia crassostreae]
MTQASTRKSHALSLWFQRKVNARTVVKMRRKGTARMMGMDMLILNTVGAKTGQPSQTPLSWFADGDDTWLVVASGGGPVHPDWYVNLMAHPDGVSAEFPGRSTVSVAPHKLSGADREQAWKLITTAQPRYAKYQRKADRQYPLVRLTPR